MGISETDYAFLVRSVDLAEQALDAGDEPFGSLLVDASGAVLREERNHVGGGDHTRHPELALAVWAASELGHEERGRATVYTSGEHCPMCAAAHAWVGLGRIVYAASSAQLGEWLAEWGVPEGPVNCLPISEIAPGVPTDGPAPELTGRLRELHRRSRQR
ncbi:nucleoside deaminase [Propioniciclava tarda]|uniref:Nucleoside deaminase n=1 Tax=Propioniciclava tarda TaxID=433330 RepID=A0A4V2JSZ7_PROTD|nr:nucleoside deaminase [Propioniciclava tarda]TBT94241.1 nucleoside deaminase [Propioniciclava tarda]SMO75231.1 tRNA(Arg) A34 adenosine deaminase TadA [Propioniciclava tarda]